ncbi:MAG: hypothetical protein Q7T57_01310, partial [Dehalococcoidales bacterium]|nr:hypothetical protein [Dehalococcoidales bacterium]
SICVAGMQGRTSRHRRQDRPPLDFIRDGHTTQTPEVAKPTYACASQLVDGTMKQQRLLNQLPTTVDQKQMAGIFKGAMKYW